MGVFVPIFVDQLKALQGCKHGRLLLPMMLFNVQVDALPQWNPSFKTTLKINKSDFKGWVALKSSSFT